MFENLKEDLVKIGLSDKEARVYLTLLQMGQGTAYKIAKKAKVKAPTTYLVLEELLEKSLVLKIPHARGQIFIAKNPDDFLQQRKNELIFLQNIIPDLKKISKIKDQNKIISFDGYEGIKESFLYRFSESKERKIYAFYANLEPEDKKLFDIFVFWDKKVLKNNIKRDIIVSNKKESLAFLKPFKELYSKNTRLLPEKIYSGKSSVEIIDSLYVRIISGEDLQALIIDNPKVAETMKQFFKIIYQSPHAKNLENF